MATVHPTDTPHRSVNAHGRGCPGLRRNSAAGEEVARGLASLAEIVNETDTDELWERFTRELDEDRLSERKRFR